LLKKQVKLNILILEKQVDFSPKLGESTSDLSAILLKDLGINAVLDKHVTKGGLRFLFDEKNTNAPVELASPTLVAPYQGYHFNREIFDEDLLTAVKEKGITVYRPAELIRFDYKPFATTCEVLHEGVNKTITAKWLIDATGRTRYLHKKLGWKDLKINLKTAAVSAQFRNIRPPKYWDMPKNEYWEKNAIGSRDFSTTHFFRDKSWWWLIRLNDEVTSIGYVFQHDGTRIENPTELLRKCLAEDQQMSAVVKGASHGPVTSVDQLAYVSDQYYAKGIALIGESASFIDPMVGPGIELICQQAIYLADLLHEGVVQERFNEKKWKKYASKFRKANLSRALIYQKGYAFMDSYDLFTNWLRVGNWVYIGLKVIPAIKFKRLRQTPFGINRIGVLGLNYLNWRLVRIHKRRKTQQRVSKVSKHRVAYTGIKIPRGIRFYGIPFNLFLRWFWYYLKLEIGELRYVFKRKE